MKDRYIADFAALENAPSFDSHYLLLEKQQRTSNNGSAYLALTFGDRSGQIEARLWEVLPEHASLAKGDVVKARACVCSYQGKLQLKVDRIREALDTEYEIADLLPRTTREISELWAELEGYVQSFTDPHLKELVTSVLQDDKIAAALHEAPAAKALHHAWIGGLLEHIVSLLGLASRAVGNYPDLNRDLILTGVLLHDIGKILELRWRTGFDYTLEGQLLGHIQIGMGLVDEKMAALPGFPSRLRTLVLHMILSHHGRLEYGSPKLPMIPEALFLHYVDDLDAKLQTMRTEIEKARRSGRAADEPTDWVRSLERPVLDTAGYLAGADKPADSR